ncbi:MAG: 50S ribosomal protein L11 methyltransferase [Chthoniobacterales bacterium]
MWIWTRITTTKWEDAWVERLRFAGEDRLALQYFPNSARMRMQVYCDHQKTAAKLKKHFGGDWKFLKPSAWQPQLSSKKKPISIRGKLLLCKEASEAKTAKGPKTRVPLIIPAGMAFGTGEHATTASCLRLLCDIQEKLPPRWSMLDLGTGTGILAIAGEKLGARKVNAVDFDPACVRATKANAETNKCHYVTARQIDVLKTTLPGKYDVVMANLFSQVLIAAAPRIAARLKPGGWLILSGILRPQLPACLAAFTKRKIRVEERLLRGKWAAVLCRKA